jgi:hypothetical protein
MGASHSNWSRARVTSIEETSKCFSRILFEFCDLRLGSIGQALERVSLGMAYVRPGAAAIGAGSGVLPMRAST